MAETEGKPMESNRVNCPTPEPRTGEASLKDGEKTKDERRKAKDERRKMEDEDAEEEK